MADCEIEYAVASFRDVEFEILPVDEAGGRRIVTHQYPFTDDHYNEDMGATATTWTVNGCFVGEDFRDKLTTAKRVWARKGAGLFFEPAENKTHNVTLLSWSFNYDEKKLNYVEFTLNFVEASEQPYPTNVANRRGDVNTSVIVEDYLTKVRKFYRDAMQYVDDFNSIVDGILASKDFIDGVARSSLVPNVFLRTKAAINAFLPSRAADSNLVGMESVYDTAIDGAAPVYFFKRSSEARSSGNGVVALQVGMGAYIAYGYYFERLAMGAVNFDELAEFRDRGISLKTAQPEIADGVDALILQLGALAADECAREGETGRHALVASYELFGEVGRAYDILLLSNGVSGAKMPALVTPCDTL